MPIERETKLLVGPDFELPNLAELVQGVVLESDEVIHQTAVYYDTPDLRLTHALVSLRYRSDDGWTVKLPEGRAAPSLHRAEHTFLGESAKPPAAALDIVRAWTRTAPLLPIATVKTRRHRFTMTDRTGRRLAEIDDDRVESCARGAEMQRFREIEVELDEHAPARLGKHLTKQLRNAGATRPSVVSKVARAVGVRAVAFGSAGNAKERGADAKSFVQAVLDDSIGQLIIHDPVIRIGEDSEGVHQARVATRKLRSHLRTFGPLLEGHGDDQLRDELGWLGDLLGRSRDSDVLSELLRATALRLPDEHRDQTRELFDALTMQGDRARVELLEAMRSRRYATLLDSLVNAAEEPQLRVSLVREHAMTVFPPLALRQWRRFRKAVRRLDDDPADADLHKVRRRAKQARYALEVATELTAGASRLARQAEYLQGVLGDHQDRVVARQWLFDAARDRPTMALIAGELAGLLLAEQHSIRADARKELRAVRKERARRLSKSIR